MFGSLRPVGESGPCSFGSAATLAYIVERRRIPVRTRLVGAGAIEFKLVPGQLPRLLGLSLALVGRAFGRRCIIG